MNLKHDSFYFESFKLLLFITTSKHKHLTPRPHLDLIFLINQ